MANDTLGFSIEEFTIFFAHGDYENLALSGAVAGWDPIVIQPDLQIPNDGFYDALALGVGVDIGSSMSGFSVSFTWLGDGLPGAQTFHIIDPVDFATLESGVTQIIPLPGAALLLLAPLGLLGIFSRRR